MASFTLRCTERENFLNMMVKSTTKGTKHSTIKVSI